MLRKGLVTVTFRGFDRRKICEAAQKADLGLLEWGGDVHVPPADEEAIAEAVRFTGGASLAVDTYGSYYRCGADEDFSPILETARKLGAQNIRVWAGRSGSADVTAEERARVTGTIRGLCERAALSGLTVSTEFHGMTLTDEYHSALRLWEEVARENFRLYWQPDQFRDDDYNRAALRAVLPHLSNVHVFAWEGQEKFPLARHEKLWRERIEILGADGRDHGLFLEFVCDGSEEQLYRDAETLSGWLE